MMNVFMKNIFIEIIESSYGYGFSLEDALSERFHDKSIISEAEVFSFLDNLKINKNNAFLLRYKR